MARKRKKKICIEIPECHILSAVSVLDLSGKEELLDTIEEESCKRRSITIDLPRMMKEDTDGELRILPVMLGVLALMQLAADIDLKNKPRPNV